ncbi:MAG: TMEM175 family protein [Methanobacteriaceae archaeon]|nr:TMEM175 family protein [Methanobacteriaceae archaeon]
MPIKNFNKTTPERLAGLIDGIYAIAMTILVLSIAVPSITNITSNVDMNIYLFDYLVPAIIMYFISFFIVANFWVNSNLLFAFKKVDNTTYFVTLLILAFICLIPFATEFLSKFWQYTQADLIFSVIIFVIGLLYLYLFVHIFKKDILIEDYKIQMKPYMLSLFAYVLFPIIAAVISIILAFFSPILSIFSYLLVLLFRVIWRLVKGRTITPVNEEELENEINNDN